MRAASSRLMGLLVLAALLSVASPAAGEGGLSLLVPKGVYAQGESISLQALGPPGAAVTFEVVGPDASGAPNKVELVLTAVADPSGRAAVTFRLPDTSPGERRVFASVNSTMFAEGSFQLSPSAQVAPPTRSLPIVEASIAGLVLLGAALASSSRSNLWLTTLLVVPLFTRLGKDEVKNQFHRGRMIQFIEDNPGASYSEIRRRLLLSNGACAYHLRVLEKGGEVKRFAQGPTVRFYPFDYRFDAEALPPLAFLQRQVLELLVDREEGSTGELAAALGARGLATTEANVSYHLRVLARDKQLVSSRREGGRTLYFLEPSPREYVARRLKEEYAADAFLTGAANSEGVPWAPSSEGSARSLPFEDEPWIPGEAVRNGAPPIPSYLVEEVFVFARDGGLLHRASPPAKSKKPRLSASMLPTVKELVRRALAGENGHEDTEYGAYRILLARGERCVLAAAVYGEPAPELREHLRRAAGKLDVDALTGAGIAGADPGRAAILDAAIRPVLDLSRGVTLEAVQAALARDPVELLSSTDFVAGFARLRVAARNRSPATVTDVGLEIDYPEASLRLDRVNPDYTWSKGRFQLGNLAPHEKKTLEFYFDPQVCVEAFLEGDLKFRDASGNVRITRMKPRRVQVVCPVFLTRGKANTAALRNLVGKVLPHSDRKVFLYPSNLGPEWTFEIAKGVVGSVGPDLVRDFVDLAPFHGEAWFYGETKAQGQPMVIRATVRELAGTLELFAAGHKAPALTGLLAELQHRLHEFVQQRAGRADVVQVTDAQSLIGYASEPTLLSPRGAVDEEPQKGGK